LPGDLERLTWAGTPRSATKKCPLQERPGGVHQANADFEISALATERLARAWQQEGDLVRAMKSPPKAPALPGIAGRQTLPQSPAHIESKSANIVTERIWNAPGRRSQCATKT